MSSTKKKKNKFILNFIQSSYELGDFFFLIHPINSFFYYYLLLFIIYY